MRLRFLVPLAGALACSTNPSVFPGGDFSGPSGLAIAPVGDRDFLFVANQGANELRAIILCNSAPGASTTCPSNQDGQFLPGPIRVFPASICISRKCRTNPVREAIAASRAVGLCSSTRRSDSLAREHCPRLHA